ncbi:DUF4259 domain-containing protein [Dietzia aerolata]|uniref:DUF4259 domain-containing protein n=1 Tax=Dietzia aerolata TaxID=595984 RepID=A0ABV5JMF9_9ACTN|nr:DUF4259 domain-containing protein [Dietzia aerolata]MBB0967638.1 DUF4259 domain-containing protein [Dietzia aerolata]
MGAWGSGIFQNDDASDWAAEFDEADPSERADLVTEALDTAVEDAAEGELDADVAGQALAAAALVARLSPGGGAVDLEGGPSATDVPGLEVDDTVRATAAKAARAAIDESSEWHELWSEAGSLDEAMSPVTEILRVLEPMS